MTLTRNRYFTPDQQIQADSLMELHADLRPPYNGLSEDEATLLHAAHTGFAPLAARNSVRRARGLAAGDDVVNLATLSSQEREALPF